MITINRKEITPVNFLKGLCPNAEINIISEDLMNIIILNKEKQVLSKPKINIAFREIFIFPHMNATVFYQYNSTEQGKKINESTYCFLNATGGLIFSLEKTNTIKKEFTHKEFKKHITMFRDVLSLENIRQVLLYKMFSKSPELKKLKLKSKIIIYKIKLYRQIDESKIFINNGYKDDVYYLGYKPKLNELFNHHPF